MIRIRLGHDSNHVSRIKKWKIMKAHDSNQIYSWFEYTKGGNLLLFQKHHRIRDIKYVDGVVIDSSNGEYNDSSYGYPQTLIRGCLCGEYVIHI